MAHSDSGMLYNDQHWKNSCMQKCEIYDSKRSNQKNRCIPYGSLYATLEQRNKVLFINVITV